MKNNELQYRITRFKRRREVNDAKKGQFLSARQYFYRIDFKWWRFWLPLNKTMYQTYADAYRTCLCDSFGKVSTITYREKEI